MLYSAAIADELAGRWHRLREAIRREGADGLLISDNVNLYYVSNRVFSGYCYLPAEGDPLFFVRRPVGLDGQRVVYIRKVEDIPDYLRANGIALPKTLMLENDSITFNEYQRYAAAFQPETVKNGTTPIRRVRSIKTRYEIEQVRRSGVLHAEVYEKIPALYKKGMTDLDLSAAIEHESRLNGSLGIFRIFGQSMEIFMGSVIAGENADNPSPYDFAMGGAGLDDSLPVGCNGTILEQGTSVMVDLGGNFTGYMTDMTRTFALGRLPDLAYQAHETSLEIQRAIEAVAHPGTEAKSLYELAVEIAAKAGLSDYFMGHRQKAGFIGHGIGIEINESPVLAPRSRDVLAEGMVFALEPKFVIPGTGAVGVENTFVVTAGGIEKLTLCNEAILPLG